ncbi:MAG: DUF4412 domain-containing protein [Thermodesulfobacteriota bacterium]
MKTMCAAFVFSFALIFAPAFAADLPDYSAEEHIEFEDGEMVGKVYHSGQKQRKEMDTEGSKMITIVRLDKKVVWMLMPESKTYMESKITDGKKDGKDEKMDFKMETEVMGEETINGMKTTKRKTVFTASDGSKFGGFSWVTKEGIVVKQYAVGKTDGDKFSMKTELKNLKIGKQDPKLFEMPAGYQKMSAFVMPSMPKTEPGEESEEESKEEPAGKKQEDIKKLLIPKIPKLW